MLEKALRVGFPGEEPIGLPLRRNVLRIATNVSGGLHSRGVSNPSLSTSFAKVSKQSVLTATCRRYDNCSVLPTGLKRNGSGPKLRRDFMT
jgi:hypothetical protein